MKRGCCLLIALLLTPLSEPAVTTPVREAGQPAAGTISRMPDVPPEPRRVLAVYWYGAEHPSTITFDQQIHAVFQKQAAGEVVHHAEYLEADRFSGEEHARILRDFMRRKYHDRKIDVLLPWGAPPLEFLLKYRNDLFPGTPIVFYASSIETVKHLAAEPLTGVLNPETFETTMELALRLHPEATQAFVISGTSSRDKLIEREASQQLEKFKNRVTFTFLTDLSYAELLVTVRSLPRRSVILYARATHEDPGVGQQPGVVLDAISRAAPVPVYSPWRSLLGHGSVGGIVDDPVGGATKAAEIALRVARGARPQHIPTDRTPRIPAFDARQLRRWGISEDRLPPGSVVLHRELTVWGQYKVYISIAGLLIALQSTFIAALLVQRTRRRRAEALLQRSEHRYELATATGHVGVWDWDLVTNEFYVDPSLKRALGFHDPEIENRREAWEMRIHPEDVARARAAAQAHIEGGTPAYHSEHRVLHKDGSIRWFVAHASAVRLPDGRAVRLIGTETDITELKVAEGKLAESQHELARVSRVSALGEFAATIGHELGHPLNAILLNAKACLRWLEDSAPPIGEVRSALRDIADASDLANEVLRRNRALFRHHTVDKQLLDIGSLVKDVTLISRVRLATSHVQLETRVHEDVPLVFGDRVELQQVLLNLLLNAMDAMETIDPGMRRLRIEARVAGPLLVQVSVRDTGIGLAGVDVERMFAPFYTTKSAGTGVGLSISRTIVEAHGGRIWVQPSEGPGATFCFTLPVATAESLGLSHRQR